MISRHVLPRYPPRKARRTPGLINFVIGRLSRSGLIPVLLPPSSPYRVEKLHELLVLTSVTRSSISRKARELRERDKAIPSGETVLRWLKSHPLDELVKYQQERFHAFLDMLPAPFQRARRAGMVLTVDFHLDPNYSTRKSEYTVTGRPKASTKQFFSYFTVLWTNAPEPVTPGVLPVQEPRSTFELVRDLLEPWITREKIIQVLADGEFYNRDIIHWLASKGIYFIMRAHTSDTIKELFKTHGKTLDSPGKGLIVDYTVKKRNVKTPEAIKLVLWIDKHRDVPFAVPTGNTLAAKDVRRLFGRRFIIETYYRMMHRFQAFSCSQHASVRFVLVSLAFWMCNLWCYFKSPLKLIKKKNKKIFADWSYSASMFCESIVESWLYLLLKRAGGF